MKTKQIIRTVWGEGVTLTRSQYQTLLEENGQPENGRPALQIALETIGLWSFWKEQGKPRSQSWFLQHVKP